MTVADGAFGYVRIAAALVAATFATEGQTPGPFGMPAEAGP